MATASATPVIGNLLQDRGDQYDPTRTSLAEAFSLFPEMATYQRTIYIYL
jgi:hypothetical protein